MAASSESFVSFDLNNSTTTTTNGYFDSNSDRAIVNGGGGGGGGGGDGDSNHDSLTCDNNNNELTKHNCTTSSTPPPPSSATTPPPMELQDPETSDGESLLAMSSLKEHLLLGASSSTGGDQSIDSGVAGGDSDETDCCGVIAPPPIVAPSPPPPRSISRTSTGTGGSSAGDSSCYSGEEEENKKESRSPPFVPLSPSDRFLQDQFFMNRTEFEEQQQQQQCEERNNGRNTLLDDNGQDVDDEEDNDVLGGSLEENSLQQNGKGFEKDCKICQNKLQSPRVLSCLHVFCETCVDGLLLTETTVDSHSIACPVCQQVTSLGRSGGGGASSLHLDYMLTNILDLSSIDLALLACTSCKGKEVAISRCNDCANILCASCDNAHQYMRCFEKHTVVRLQDLICSSVEKVAIHKPLFCTVHPAENLKYYCQHCQVPVCNECLIGDHKGGEHSYEIIADAEMTARAELERLSRNSQSQVEHCNEAQLILDGALTELQSQHDTARALIEESYQSFKAVLEKCRDNALKQLDTLHSERELKVMEVMHDVEKSTEKIETANRFTDRVLSACNGAELLSLRALIGRQFGHLSETIPRSSVSYSLEFESQFEQFQRLAQDTFGKFRTEATAPSPKESTPPPTLPGMPPSMLHREMSSCSSQGGYQSQPPSRSLMNGSQNMSQNSLMGISAFNGTQSGALTNSVTASSPISLPPSMQSSFDGEMSAMTQPPSSASTTGSGPSFGSLMDHHPHMHVMNGGAGGQNNPPPSVLVPPMNVPPPSLVPGGGLSSIAEYNIQQLANLVEQNSVGSSNGGGVSSGADMTDGIMPTVVGPVTVPPPSAPGANQGAITLNDILSIDPHALQAWSKMGGLNQQTANALLSRGPSPSVDNLLLNDFSAIAPNGDDLMLANFNGNGNGPGVITQQGQQQSGQSIGVPGRTKSTAMQIRCKFGSLGPSKGQFNSPHGFCLGVDEEIVVADTNNHRIEVFEKTGTFKFQFGVPGKDEGQLWYPRKVAVMRPSSKFVVCDRGNERSRMQIFNKAGHFMKKIAIRYIDIVAGLAVTNQGHIVAVDSVSPTVFIISEEGELVHWFDCSDYMREPSDIAINGNDFYVCDFKGHCVAVFSDDGTFKYRIGNEKITCFPNGIDISDAGDILIGDSHGNRFHVACFSRDGVLQSEYECPYVKVSRCCGLKITSEGFVVTLAKNNHHVLVLNTLYIQ